jgi:hypothetical protein
MFFFVLLLKGYWYIPIEEEEPFLNTRLQQVLSADEFSSLKSKIPDKVLTDEALYNIVSKTSEYREVIRNRKRVSVQSDVNHNNGFIVDGPVAFNKRSGLMWMRCPSERFYLDGVCEIRAKAFEIESLMRMLNTEELYGFNDWRTANIREIAEITSSNSRSILPVFAKGLNSEKVSTTIFDKSDIPHLPSALFLPSKDFRYERWESAYFVRGGGVY